MQWKYTRGGSRAASTSKMECFVIIVNGFQPLAIITKHSILGIAAALDPLLGCVAWSSLHMLQIVLIVRKWYFLWISQVIIFLYIYFSCCALHFSAVFNKNFLLLLESIARYLSVKLRLSLMQCSWLFCFGW